jgi:ribonuclease Z
LSPADKEFFTLETPHFTIEGRSRAGHETYFRIRELGIALDIGRCPDLLVHLQHIFITHTHIDHAAGIAFYAGQRRLQALEGGTIYVPEECADDVRELLAIQSRLTGAELRKEVVVAGVAVGDEIRFSRTHSVRAHAAPHRVAARAWEFVEVRHHLRAELAGLGGDEIARLRRVGVAVDEPYTRSILFYTGDTDRTLLESCAAVYKAEVLMIECSFLTDGHQERAEKYRHIHIDDIADFADRFENELIVLTHFSRRYSRDQIQTAVKRRLPASLHERVRLALPEPFQRL